MKKFKFALGCTLIASPFLVMFGCMIYTNWRGLLLILLILGVIIGVVTLGMYLIDNS